MQSRRELREVAIPAFEQLLAMFYVSMKSAVERCLGFNENVGPESIERVHGQVYEEMHGLVLRQLNFLCNKIETIEGRVRQLTGESADELDARELDFWGECNTAA
jgi:hypothetical protein